MMLGELTLVEAPTLQPITLQEAKDHLHVESDWQDSFIDSAIAAASEWAELYTSRAFIRQTWELTLDCFPEEIKIPMAPILEVSSIYYVDTDGIETLLDPSLYDTALKGYPPRIVPSYGNSWPSTRAQPEAVAVTFIAGYSPDGSPEDLRANVPESIKNAIKLLVADLFENRDGAIVGKPFSSNPTALRLLNAYRPRWHW